MDPTAQGGSSVALRAAKEAGTLLQPMAPPWYGSQWDISRIR